MPETLLERHYRDRMQSLRQMTLPEAGHAALSARDVPDLVNLCFELSVSGRQLLEDEYRQIFHEPDLTVTWLQEHRRVLEELVANYQQLAESIRATVYQTWQAAGVLRGMDLVNQLDEAIRAVVQVKQQVLERWPVGNDSEVAEAQAAAARSEGLDLDEAFAQIAGVDVETWRRRVEEYNGSPVS